MTAERSFEKSVSQTSVADLFRDGPEHFRDRLQFKRFVRKAHRETPLTDNGHSGIPPCRHEASMLLAGTSSPRISRQMLPQATSFQAGIGVPVTNPEQPRDR
jgi:hypothetical protein